MTENRRYYYLKVKENFYDSEAMKILENMQDGMIFSNLLMKMYLMSLKNNGILMLTERKPHTPQTIATCTRHQTGTVERAIQIFIELGLVEILNDGTIYMSDIQLLIGQSSTEGERKKRERLRLQEKNLLPPQVDICPSILEIELEKDTEIEKEIPPSAFAFYGRYKNVCLSPTDLDDLKTELPDTWEHYINRLSEYMASTGKNYDNHAATIRRWAANDTEKNNTVQGVTALSCKEGTSL